MYNNNIILLHLSTANSNPKEKLHKKYQYAASIIDSILPCKISQYWIYSTYIFLDGGHNKNNETLGKISDMYPPKNSNICYWIGPFRALAGTSSIWRMNGRSGGCSVLVKLLQKTAKWGFPVKADLVTPSNQNGWTIVQPGEETRTVSSL